MKPCNCISIISFLGWEVCGKLEKIKRLMGEKRIADRKLYLEEGSRRREGWRRRDIQMRKI